MRFSVKKAIDLFAGAGGLSTGLELAGFEILFANEISSVFSSSLQINHPRTLVANDDIRDLDTNKIRKKLGVEKGELDLIAGGPPCQGFSVNAPIRSQEDERNHLFVEYLKFVEEFLPKALIIENVPGIVSFEKGNTVRAIINSLESLGYSVDVKILYMANYGVPQMRWRTIFIANRIGVCPLDMFPQPKNKLKGRPNFTTKMDNHSLLLEEEFFVNALEPFVTVRDAISDLPPIANRGGLDTVDYQSTENTDFQKWARKNSIKIHNHICSGLGTSNLKRLPYIPQGGSWRDIPFDLLPEGMKRARRSDHTQRYGRLDWNCIGSTILTKCDPHWGRFIHPDQDRVISVREAARIQSFPDSSRFLGNLAEQYKQVGNAVPPMFAFLLGRSISKALDGQQLSDKNLINKVNIPSYQQNLEFV